MNKITTSIEKMTAAKQMLIEAKTLDDILKIKDIAEAGIAYAKAANLGTEVVNAASEVSILAKIKAGEAFSQLEREPGERTDRTSGNVARGSEYRAVLDATRTTRRNANRWEQMAKVPMRIVNEYISKMNKAGKDVVASAIVAISKKARRDLDIKEQRAKISQELVPPDGLFGVIVVDPPWPYGTKYDPTGRRAANPYPEMSLEKIGAIKLYASDDCVLWLWTTHKFMRHSFALLDTWGFRDVAILTWVKDKIGLGVWLRSQSEFCIMAVKGNPTVDLTNQTTILNGVEREHSRKPDEFYAMVDALCIGHKLDYFSREQRAGWAAFGNDTERF